MDHPANLYNKKYSKSPTLNGKYFRLRKIFTNRKIISLLNPKSDDAILEIGCNSGQLMKEISKYCKNITGVDINEYAVKNCSMPNVFVMDATNLKFLDASFTKIYSAQCIEHIPDIKKALNEMSRVLKKNGRIVLIYPWEIFRGSNTIFDALICYRDIFKCRELHLHKITPKLINSLISETRLKIIKKGVFFSPFPAYYTVLKKF